MASPNESVMAVNHCGRHTLLHYLQTNPNANAMLVSHSLNKSYYANCLFKPFAFRI